jgi:hypothetical protein
MKIIDSFLFSEAYERELLLLKFILEDRGVDEWIILENSYSFQGDYKGLQARKLIYSDNRFACYRNKIRFIEREEKTKVLPKHQMLDEESYKVEFWQRDLAQDYFLEHYSEDDWIMISDVDEMIDFTDTGRSRELFKRMQISTEGVLNIPIKRFWYDFDNEYKVLLWRPLCNKRYLLYTGKKLHEVRSDSFKRKEKNWKNIIGFEYSSCYDREFILRKFYTSTHTGLGAEDLQTSLRYNHRPVSLSYINKVRKDKKFFFETVPLTGYNSPAIVRENLAVYKTNAIDKNYKRNRKEAYPEAFSIKGYMTAFFSDHINLLKKKFRFLMRRMGTEKFMYK